jgi:hypothetical protein
LKENKNYLMKYILFIVFPLEEVNKNKWKIHIKKIKNLVKLNEFIIQFKEGQKGRMYLGKVK